MILTIVTSVFFSVVITLLIVYLFYRQIVKKNNKAKIEAEKEYVKIMEQLYSEINENDSSNDILSTLEKGKLLQ